MGARARLALLAGIEPRTVDAFGRSRPVRPAVRAALLAALGFDASSDAAAARELARLAAESRARVVEPVGVVRGRARAVVAARWPGRGRKPVAWTLEVATEDGRLLARSGRSARANLALPLPRLPFGVHRLIVRLARETEEHRGEQTLIVAPARCVAAPRRAFGLWTHLYAARGANDLGCGDLGTLRELIDFAAARGAAFVGVNPLHAIRATRDECSPYSPISRVFRTPLYLDVTAVPELARRPDVRRRLARLRPADPLRVDWDRVRKTKDALLRPLFDAFRARPGSARFRAFSRYCDEHGRALIDHATFVALDRRLRGDWRRWPARFRDPRGAAVARFRKSHATEIDFQRWLQFELDRQLGAMHARALRRGVELGVYGDLAIGSIANGSDAWADPAAFVTGASLGAPPDGFSRHGQVWNLPPLDPLRSRATGHAGFRRLLAAAFTHAGLVRLDHVIGLARQYWVPAGQRGDRGAFVTMPADELFALIALASRRAGTCVVGEDLGTLPPGLRERLAREAILGSAVFLFDPAARRRDVLATANTHDLPPLAGWLAGADLPILRHLGLLANDAALRRARGERERAVRRLERVFRGASTPPDRIAAVYEFLARGPARLVGVALDDLTLETEPLNVPTATPRRHPVWSRRSRISVAELARDRWVNDVLRRVGGARRVRGR